MDLLDQFEVQLSKVSIMTLYNGGLWVIGFLVYIYVSQPTTRLLGRLVPLHQSPKDMIVVCSSVGSDKHYIWSEPSSFSGIFYSHIGSPTLYKEAVKVR